MTLNREIDFIDNLFRNYKSIPVKCDCCGKSIPFRKWVLQFHQSKKYCSKKCREKCNFKGVGENFASKTEKAIFVFLALSYPNSSLRHNIKDFIAPYEIDFAVDDIFVEYCGNFHFSTKRKGLERKVEKTKLNDKKKRDLICIDNNRSLIRIWAEIGLYSRPRLFNLVLKILKHKLNELMESGAKSVCIEICVDKDEKIHCFQNN